MQAKSAGFSPVVIIIAVAMVVTIGTAAAVLSMKQKPADPAASQTTTEEPQDMAPADSIYRRKTTTSPTPLPPDMTDWKSGSIGQALYKVPPQWEVTTQAVVQGGVQARIKRGTDVTLKEFDLSIEILDTKPGTLEAFRKNYTALGFKEAKTVVSGKTATVFTSNYRFEGSPTLYEKTVVVTTTNVTYLIKISQAGPDDTLESLFTAILKTIEISS